MFNYERRLKNNARQLRKRMTDAEVLLWLCLRGKQLHGVQFYRQKPIGAYIVDFHAPACRLVIELDGSQHHTPEGVAVDAARDAALAALGQRVMRFTNHQVLAERDVVVRAIYEAIEERLGRGGEE